MLQMVEDHLRREPQAAQIQDLTDADQVFKTVIPVAAVRVLSGGNQEAILFHAEDRGPADGAGRRDLADFKQRIWFLHKHLHNSITILRNDRPVVRRLSIFSHIIYFSC